MNFEFLPEARTEFELAVTHYDQCGLGLGDEFTDETEAAFHRIVDHPEAWPPYHHGTRRCLTSRFPYGIVYQIHSDRILIVAVAHLRREPEYWIARVANPM